MARMCTVVRQQSPPRNVPGRRLPCILSRLGCRTSDFRGERGEWGSASSWLNGVHAIQDGQKQGGGGGNVHGANFHHFYTHLYPLVRTELFLTGKLQIQGSSIFENHSEASPTTRCIFVLFFPIILSTPSPFLATGPLPLKYTPLILLHVVSRTGTDACMNSRQTNSFTTHAFECSTTEIRHASEE